MCFHNLYNHIVIDQKNNYQMMHLTRSHIDAKYFRNPFMEIVYTIFFGEDYEIFDLHLYDQLLEILFLFWKKNFFKELFLHLFLRKDELYSINTLFAKTFKKDLCDVIMQQFSCQLK